jgi:hypothetical protein
VLALAFLVLGASMAGPAVARNVALLIAVGQFKDPQLKPFELKGTAADIESMQRALSEHWGFAPGDIRALRDQDATRERILAEISALEQRSAPGDTVLIYFSGHGTSANDENNQFDLPYATGAWVPYDLDYSSSAAAGRTLVVGRTDLVPRLKVLDQGGRFIVVVSDSCYSGQVVRSFGQSHARTRFLPMPSRDLGVAHVVPAPTVSARPPPPPYPYQHVVLLSGASDSETGADISTDEVLQRYPTLDGKYHGAFTDAFLRLLDGQLVPGTFNYSVGRQEMSKFLERQGFAQHPQLLPALAEDPQDVQSRPFLGMKTAASPGGTAAPIAAVAAAGAGAAAASAAPATPAAAARDPTVHLRLESVSPALRSKVAALSGVAIVDRNADMTLRQHGDQAELAGPAGDPIVKAPAADPNLIKRIAAQVWLNRVLPAGNDSLGLKAETDPGSRGNTFVQCESFIFEVRLQKPAYLMVMDLDSAGKVTVLYPTKASEREVISPGAPRAIPNADPKSHIVVTPPFGSDQVAVLAFQQMPAFFADLNGADPFAADGNRADALAKGLATAAGAVSVQQITIRTYPGTGIGLCGSGSQTASARTASTERR